MDDGVLKIWGVSDNHHILGVIATRDIDHISMFFVDKDYQRKGIGKAFFNTVLCYYINNGKKEITVNSSPCTEGVYHSLGFKDTDKQKETNGIKFTSMSYVV